MSVHVCINCGKKDRMEGVNHTKEYREGLPLLSTMNMSAGDDENANELKAKLEKAGMGHLVFNSVNKEQRKTLFLCRNCNLGEDHDLTEPTEEELEVAKLSPTMAITYLDHYPLTVVRDKNAPNGVRKKSFQELQYEYAAHKNRIPARNAIVKAALVLNYPINTKVNLKFYSRSENENKQLMFLAELKRITKTVKRHQGELTSLTQVISSDAKNFSPAGIYITAAALELKGGSKKEILDNLKTMKDNIIKDGVSYLEELVKSVDEQIKITSKDLEEIEKMSPGSTEGIEPDVDSDAPINEIEVEEAKGSEV